MPDRPAQDGAAQPTPIGERLRQAREAAGVPVEKIAEDLLLDPSVLEHLEADEFAALGAPVFVRGHLRKYALWLGLPADELVDIYHREHDRPQGLPVINESLAFRDRRRGNRFLLPTLLVIGVAAAAVFLFRSFRDEPRDVVPETAALREEPVLETTPAIGESLIASSTEETEPAYQPPQQDEVDEPPEAMGDATQITAESDPDPAPPAPAQTLPEASAAISASLVDVSFTFTQDSWIEVYDATGARLLYAMGRAGSTRNVSGEPPLRVFLGLATAVGVRVNGAPYVVPAERIRGNVARFVIDGERVAAGGQGAGP